MTSSLLADWTSFFTSTAEAAATLGGLVMVAISVNLQRILAHKHLPARASGAVGAMVVVMIIGLLGLIPQAFTAFTIEMYLTAVAAWTVQIVSFRDYIPGHIAAGRPRRERVISLVLSQAQTLPLTVGAVALTFDKGVGLYWIAGAVIASLIAAAMNAWILLVEILRR